jgi:hypothetical protein
MFRDVPEPVFLWNFGPFVLAVALWLAAGYAGETMLRRKGYGRTDNAAERDIIHVGGEAGTEAGDLLPVFAGPLTLLIATLLRPKRLG